jgi:hypothetical protein
VTRLLDDAFRIPGTRIRFGLDSILGAVLPGAGDALTAVGSVSLLLLALKQRVPTGILVRMLFNIAIDAILGAIPVLGDLFDVAYKANRRNLQLLESHTLERERRTRPVDYLVVGLALVVVIAAVLLPFLLWAFVFGLLGAQS